MVAGRQPAVRAVWALCRELAASPAARLVPPELRWRVRRRLLPVRAADVLEAVEVLGDAGVSAWLAGGWGVDALLGRQTRRHADLDLVLDANEGAERRASRALGRLGFQPKEDRDLDDGSWISRRLRLQDDAGRIVELLLVDLPGLAAADPAVAASAGPFAKGTIGGRPVACVSAPVQLALHLGYRPDGIQRHDVHRLCRRFRLPVPEPYR